MTALFVVKTDGKAMGKGVMVGDLEQTLDSVRSLLTSRKGSITVEVLEPKKDEDE